MNARAEAMTEEPGPIGALIASGDHRAAIALCARQHGESIGRLCMALLRSQAEAEETAQEVLLAAHDAMGSYRGEGSVRAWLLGIARRQCARRITKQSRRRQRLHLVGAPESTEPAPDLSVDLQRRRARLEEALADLKPADREVVLLRYQSELGYREIGEACGIPEAAARKRASRALGRLRTLLKDEEWL